MKRTIGLLFLIFITAGLLFSCLHWGPTKKFLEPRQRATTISETYTAFDGSFLNKVDGYSLLLPENAVLDMSMSEVGAVLRLDAFKLEIYREPMETRRSFEDFEAYCFKFLSGNDIKAVTRRKSETASGLKADIISWSRDKLSALENDRNNYSYVGIRGENALFMLLFKAENPLDDGVIDGFVKSFEICAPSILPKTAQLEATPTMPWSDETQSYYGNNFGKNARLSFGIFQPGAPEYMNGIEELERRVNYSFKTILQYNDVFFGEAGLEKLESGLKNAYSAGLTPELTFQAAHPNENGVSMVYDILNDKYSVFLADYAGIIKEFGHPVLLRLGNEMNGDWCMYSAYHTALDTDIYQAFYAYIYKYFEASGADNIIWVWNPNERSYPNYKWNHELLYYPQNAPVNILGLTGYNNGTYYKGFGERWRSFDEIYQPLYDKASARFGDSMPFMITEFASSSIGGDKAQWVRDMFESIKKYDRIKQAVWWSAADMDGAQIARPYYMDETDETLAAFCEGLSGVK